MSGDALTMGDVRRVSLHGAPRCDVAVYKRSRADGAPVPYVDE